MFEAELRLIAIDLQGQTLDGRYRLDALLDVGSDRMLWRATDQNRQQTVAIQIWARESTPAESDLNAALSRQPENVHPVFAHYEGCGRAPSGGGYAVYPAFIGRYLEGWLAENAIGMADLVELGSELASAVAALHKSGHVHGKLDKSVVLASDESGTVMRIVDAGLAGLAAVPRGSAVKGEMTRVGELVDRLLRAAATAPDMTPEAMHELEGLVARTRDNAANPLADMDQFAERLQALLEAAPPHRARGAQRKVTTTMDFASHPPRPGDVLASAGASGGLPSLEGSTLDLSELESFASAAQGSASVDLAQLADPHGDYKGEPAAGQSTSESSELPELPPPSPLDASLGTPGAPEPIEAAPPASLAVGAQTGPPVPRPPTVQLPAWPETKRKSKVDPKALVVAGLLVLMIGVFVFVLLPGPDRPATPLEALRVTPADVVEPVTAGVVNGGNVASTGAADRVEAAVDAGPSDAMAVLNIEEEPEPDTGVAAELEVTVEAAADIATEPDTAVAAAPDVMTEPDTAVAVVPDVVTEPDTAVAVVPDVVTEPDTAVAVVAPVTVATPDVAVAQPETAPASSPDTDLPVRQVMNSKDDIRAAMAATEEALKKSRKDGKGAGVTRPLQQRLLATFKEGKPVTVHPFGMYHLAMYMLDSGAPAGTIGAVILSTHESGGF